MFGALPDGVFVTEGFRPNGPTAKRTRTPPTPTGDFLLLLEAAGAPNGGNNNENGPGMDTGDSSSSFSCWVVRSHEGAVDLHTMEVECSAMSKFDRQTHSGRYVPSSFVV